MNVLIVGIGVIGTIYGWAFKKARGLPSIRIRLILMESIGKSASLYTAAYNWTADQKNEHNG